MASLFMEGLLLQASLIFALGAQNLFVLESGVRRHYPISISFVCFACDLILIMLGVAGAGSLFSAFPQIKIVVGSLGVIFMFQYGLGKLLSPASEQELNEVLEHKKNLKRSLMLAVTFSILNPHAYLDAFILIGGFSSKYNDLTDRVLVGLGASVFSLIWFLALSGASSVMKPLLCQPSRMRVVTSLAGLFLLFLSAKLGMDVYSWIKESQSVPTMAVNEMFNGYPPSPGHLFTSILF
jgi:L-lysine exporter family protein LysE/ArgO